MAEAQLLASGGRLYADVWEHKQPGVVALYGAAMALVGDDHTDHTDDGADYRAIQLLNAIAGFATAALLALLFRRVGCSTPIGFCAGALYLLFYGSPIFGGFWATAQVEIFLDPFVAAALYGLMPRGSVAGRGEAAPSRGRLFAAGVALGSAVFWLKYSCAPLAGLALLAWWSPASPVASSLHWRQRVARVALVAAGMSFAPLIMLLYFGWDGRVGEFWDSTVVFNITHSGVSAFRPDGPAHWIALLFIRPSQLAALYMFSAVAFFGRFSGTQRRAAGVDHSPRDWLLSAGFALWLLAFCEVALQGKFWIYHYHVVLLPLVITAALGLEFAAGRLAERIGRSAAWSATAAIALALLWPHAALMSEYAEVHRILAYRSGESSREEFLSSYQWGGGGDYDAAENVAVAARVAGETQPGDAIFVWGFEPSIYLLSGRAPASRFLYDYPLMPELQGVHERHVEWLMEDLEASAPALFLVLHRDLNDLESRDSAAQLQALPPLRSYLARYYQPAWRMGDFSAFRRQAQALGE